MYFGTVSFVTVALCFKLIAGEVKSEVTNSAEIKNSTLPESGVKIPLQPDGPKESNQRRRGMESEMAYPQGYFPPFSGDFQPSTTPYNHVPMRRESVPIIIERTISSQPAIITRNPIHRTIVSNVYTQPGHQQVYFHTNLDNGYQIPGQGMYKPQATFTDTSYLQKPLFQQPEYQIYNTYQDPNKYQLQSFHQVPQITSAYPSVPNYNPQTTAHNQYGLQNDGGYPLDQPADNTRILEREIQTLRELEEQHRRLLQQINARTQGVVYYNRDSSLTRKVITQYPNEQSTPQFSSQPSYSNGNSPGTFVIMDPSSQGMVSEGNPYSTTQIRISRHPGQIPSPAPLEQKYKRGMETPKRKADIKLVRETKMTVPVVIGLKLSPSDQSNLWNYFELKSSEHVRSIYQSNPQKSGVPYPDLLPPCPGGFLCDDIANPATTSDENLHGAKNPQIDDQHTSKNDGEGKEKGETNTPEPPHDESTQSSGNMSKDDETRSSTPDRSTTENTAIVMPESDDDDDDPEKDTDNFIFLGSDDSEEPTPGNDPTNDLDPRLSTGDPEPHAAKTDGIMYKLGE